MKHRIKRIALGIYIYRGFQLIKSNVQYIGRSGNWFASAEATHFEASTREALVRKIDDYLNSTTKHP